MTGVPLEPPGPGYVVRQIPVPAVPALSMAAMLELAERARAEFLAERLRLERALTEAIEQAGLVVVRTDPVEQVAAHPFAEHRLRCEIFAQAVVPPLGQHSPIGDLPVVVDKSLPPGEVHLRPHPRRPDGAS